MLETEVRASRMLASALPQRATGYRVTHQIYLFTKTGFYYELQAGLKQLPRFLPQPLKTEMEPFNGV